MVMKTYSASLVISSSLGKLNCSVHILYMYSIEPLVMDYVLVRLSVISLCPCLNWKVMS